MSKCVGISSKGDEPIGSCAGDGDDIVESLPCVKILVFSRRRRHSIREKESCRKKGDERFGHRVRPTWRERGGRG